MRCLVTGGTGFVGTVLVKQLVSRYGAENVICIAKQDEDEIERIGRETLDTLGVRIITADIREWQPDPQEIPEFDVLFHLAASIDNLASGHSTNDVGTQRLLDVLGKRLQGTRVIYTGSTASMDRKGYADAPLNEETPCTPRTEYGETKLRGEEIVESTSTRFGYSYTIVRLGLVYGPNYREEGFFGLFTQWIKQGHFLARIRWPARTGIIYVDDVSEVLIDFATNPKAENELFCAATESPRICEIVELMALATGSPYKPITLPNWIWRAQTHLLCIPGLFNVMPNFLFGHFWRLSHMVQDGLWTDGSKLKRAYGKTLLSADEAVKRMYGER